MASNILSAASINSAVEVSSLKSAKASLLDGEFLHQQMPQQWVIQFVRPQVFPHVPEDLRRFPISDFNFKKGVLGRRWSDTPVRL